MTPTIMRMVLYVCMDGKTIRPAIIHDVHSPTCVSLSVFMGGNDASQYAEHEDAHAVERVTSVQQDQEGKTARSWHWNEHQVASGKPSH